MRLGKAARVTGALAGLVLLGAAIITPRSPNSPFASITFSVRGVSFDYPAAWSARHLTGEGSFGYGMARISSQGFTIPCQAESCYLPAGGALAPGGLFATVEALFPFSIGQPVPALGTPLVVGGFPARWRLVAVRDLCRSMGGTRAVDVTIERGQGASTYFVGACLRAPTARTENDLRQLLETMRFADSPTSAS